MRLIALPALMALAALAACNQGSSDAEVATIAEPAAPAAVLGDVDLTRPIRALGTEPFWSVELNGAQMIYTDPTPVELSAAQPPAVIQGTIAIYQAEAGGQAFKVTLTDTECSDGMSDRTYPLSAIVQIGDRTLTGCAASASAIMTAPESGPVVDAPAA